MLIMCGVPVNDVCDYPGFQLTDYRRHLLAVFSPFVDAARRVVLTACYTCVVALSAVLACHVLGWSLARCLRLRPPAPLTRPPSATTTTTFTLTASSPQRSLSVDGSLSRRQLLPRRVPGARPPGGMDGVVPRTKLGDDNGGLYWTGTTPRRVTAGSSTAAASAMTLPRVGAGVLASPLRAVSLTMRPSDTSPSSSLTTSNTAAAGVAPDFRYSETNV